MTEPTPETSAITGAYPEPDEPLAAANDAAANDANDNVRGDGYTVPEAPAQTPEDNQLAIKVEEAMYEVVDPELGVNVVDLGLVYDIWIENGSTAVIFMTLTSPACPLTDMLTDQTNSEVGRVEGIEEIDLNWVWSPAWGPQMITEEGREQMRALGFSV